MSFVLSVSGGNFSIMMSDGRVNKFGDNRVAGEEYQKVFQMNALVCLGITGDPVAVYYAFSELTSYNVEKITMEKMKRVLVNALKEVPITGEGVQFILSGKNKAGKFVTYSVDSKNNFEEEVFESSENTGFTIVHTGGTTPGIRAVVANHFPSGKVWESLEEIREQMKACIEAIAEVDSTVNKNVYEVMVIEP